jgi:hypothetical protein
MDNFNTIKMPRIGYCQIRYENHWNLDQFLQQLHLGSIRERWTRNCYNSGNINYLRDFKYRQVCADVDIQTCYTDITKHYAHCQIPNCVTCQFLAAIFRHTKSKHGDNDTVHRHRQTDRNRQVIHGSSFINIVIRYLSSKCLISISHAGSVVSFNQTGC